MVLPATAKLTNLIVVCCHATYRGGNPDDEASWILQDFQKSNAVTGKIGEHHTFMEHISAGVSMLAKDPSAFLLFSGGMTQSQIETSEAHSYRDVAFAMDNSRGREHRDSLTRRCSVENYATDSFQNLLFSIICFKIVTGSYPAQVTVITHAFKELRFLELHGPAIKYPAAKLRVYGINPPMDLKELRDVQHGERKRGYEAFAKDPYGVGNVLGSKRDARGWTIHGTYPLTRNMDPEVKRLLSWTGGTSGDKLFDGKLPWESDRSL